MPAKVAFPLHVRTDARALAENHDELLECVSAAASRALANCSRSVSLGARDVRVPAPSTDIYWSGPGLASVTDDQRLRLEAELQALIETLVSDATLDETLLRAAAPAEPRELADESRLDRWLGLYTIPSYEGGDPVSMPVNADITFDADQLYRHTKLEWEPIGSLEELVRAFRAAFEAHYELVPGSGLTGAIYLDAHRGMSITLWHLPYGSFAGTLPVSGIVELAPDPTGKSIVARPAKLTLRSSYRLHYLGSMSADNRVAVLTELYGQQLAAAFRSNARGRHGMSEAEFEDQLKERVEQAAAVLAKRIPDNVACVLGLEVDGVRQLLFSNENIGENLDVELLAITREVPQGPRARKAQAQGEGRGARARERRGPGPGKGRIDGEPGGGEKADTEPPPLPPPEKREGSSVSGTGACQPFRGEPSVEQLGTVGAGMRDEIGVIADRLEIRPCEYGGHFLIAAASAIGQLAAQVGEGGITDTGTALPAAPDEGTLGSLEFQPHASAELLSLRNLASVVPLITSLSRWIQEVVEANREMITDEYERSPAAWRLHFIEDLHPILDASVAEIFKMTCRVVFLQLLNSSRVAIHDRLDEPGFTRFADLFERHVMPLLADVDELIRLRERLQQAQADAEASRARQQMAYAYVATVPGAPRSAAPAAAAPPPPAGWREARARVSASLSPSRHLTEGEAVAGAYETIEEAGTMRIRDRHGDLWSVDELEQAIVLRRGTVESIEPLIKQLVDLPDVMERFRRGKDDLRGELKSVLQEMADSNTEITRLATDDPDYAFQVSDIGGDVESATVSGTAYALQGMHLLAHREIGEFFEGDAFYARGVDFALGAEKGKQRLGAFGEFVGLVLLSVVCPPAAVYVGVGLAVYHYEEAREHQVIYRALIDPEQIRSYAEVEAELFGAELGLALSLLPIAGEVVGEARAAFRVAAGEVAEVSEAAAREAARKAAGALIHKIELGLAERFVVEAAKAYVLQKVFDKALAPIMEALEREWGTTGPIGGLDQAMAELAHRAHERNTASAPAGGQK